MECGGDALACWIHLAWLAGKAEGVSGADALTVHILSGSDMGQDGILHGHREDVLRRLAPTMCLPSRATGPSHEVDTAAGGSGDTGLNQDAGQFGTGEDGLLSAAVEQTQMSCILDAPFSAATDAAYHQAMSGGSGASSDTVSAAIGQVSAECDGICNKLKQQYSILRGQLKRAQLTHLPPLDAFILLTVSDQVEKLTEVIEQQKLHSLLSPAALQQAEDRWERLYSMLTRLANLGMESGVQVASLQPSGRGTNETVLGEQLKKVAKLFSATGV